MFKSLLLIVSLAGAVALAACSSAPVTPAQPDSKIKQDIETSLDAANITGVTVSVQNGMVTLTGSVADQATVDKVIAIARSTSGVTTVESQLGFASTPTVVVDANNQDSILMAKVQQKLLADPALAGSSITPAVAGGVATLTGTAPSDAARAAAEKTAKSVQGIASVVNNVQVVAPAAPEAPVADPQLEAAVGAELDKRFPDLTLFVQVKDGVISLSGAVPNQSTIIEVTKAVHQVKGVKAVDTGRLTVQGGEPDDKRIGSPATGKKQ